MGKKKFKFTYTKNEEHKKYTKKSAQLKVSILRKKLTAIQRPSLVVSYDLMLLGVSSIKTLQQRLIIKLPFDMLLTVTCRDFRCIYTYLMVTRYNAIISFLSDY